MFMDFILFVLFLTLQINIQFIFQYNNTDKWTEISWFYHVLSQNVLKQDNYEFFKKYVQFEDEKDLNENKINWNELTDLGQLNEIIAMFEWKTWLF
jgi:hypothetical protein